MDRGGPRQRPLSKDKMKVQSRLSSRPLPPPQPLPKGFPGVLLTLVLDGLSSLPSLWSVCRLVLSTQTAVPNLEILTFLWS